MAESAEDEPLADGEVAVEVVPAPEAMPPRRPVPATSTRPQQTAPPPAPKKKLTLSQLAAALNR
jgi:hypothetical protein